MLKRQLALILFLSSTGVFAFENLKTDELPNFDYSADVRFSLHVPLFKIGSESKSTNTNYPEGTGTSYRSPGLRSADFQLGFEDFHQSALNIGLRPDVFEKKPLPGERAPRDFDSRTGSVYRAKPQIFLLNQYQFGLLFGDQLKLSYGVWQDLDLARFPFSVINEFGLLVQLPRNFSGFRSDLHAFVSSSSNFDLSLLVIQGREERVDNLASNDQSLDTSTSARNPYWGGAVLVRWLIESSFDGTLLAGFEERREFSGKVQEAYAGVFLVKQVVFGERKIALNLDSRISHERWFGAAERLPKLIQANVSLFGKVEITRNADFVLGLHTGKSDRFSATQDKSLFRGRQLDLGVVAELRKHLSFGFIVSDEQRDLTDNGIASPGFMNASAKDHIVRLGLDFRYRL